MQTNQKTIEKSIPKVEPDRLESLIQELLIHKNLF